MYPHFHLVNRLSELTNTGKIKSTVLQLWCLFLLKNSIMLHILEDQVLSDIYNNPQGHLSERFPRAWLQLAAEGRHRQTGWEDKHRNWSLEFALLPWYVLHFFGSALQRLSHCQFKSASLFKLQLSLIFFLICSLCTNCLSLPDMNEEYKCVMPD